MENATDNVRECKGCTSSALGSGCSCYDYDGKKDPIKNNSICVGCGNTNRLPSHKYCSQECYWKSARVPHGTKSPQWKEKTGKSNVHKWLSNNYREELKICEGTNCRKNSDWYDWALKKGCVYDKKRENFVRLCRSCHRRYDLTPEKVRKAISNLWPNNKQLYCVNCKKVEKEWKEKVVRIEGMKVIIPNEEGVEEDSRMKSYLGGGLNQILNPIRKSAKCKGYNQAIDDILLILNTPNNE